MIRAAVGQGVHRVQLVPLQRRLGRIDHQHLVVVVFDDRLSVYAVVVPVLDSEGFGVGAFVVFQFFVGVAVRLSVLVEALRAGKGDLVPRLGQIRGAPHVADLFHRHAPVQKLRQAHDGPLPHAVHENVGPGIHQDGAADVVSPVVVMRTAAEGRL